MRPSSSARIACIAYSCGIRKGVDSIDSIRLQRSLLTPAAPLFHFRTRKDPARGRVFSGSKDRSLSLPVVVMSPVMTDGRVRGDNRPCDNGKRDEGEEQIAEH